MKVCEIFKSILKWTLILFGIILIECIVPFIVILLLLPMYIVRVFVLLLNKINLLGYNQGFVHHMISGFSACAASDHIYTTPSYTVLTFFFEARHVQVQDYQKLITEKVLQFRNLNGKLYYPELTQYVSYWLGFAFWKTDENFHISNHVKLYEGAHNFNSERKFTENELMKLANELLTKPYMKNKSPWEILVLPNAQSHASKLKGNENYENCEQTAIIFRFHHTLADGFSSIRLLLQINKGQLYKVPKQWEQKVSQWKRFFLILFYPFISIPIIMPVGWTYFDDNAWLLKDTHKIRKSNFACSKPISVDYIKEVKNSIGVSFSAAVVAAITGGFRNYMLENKMSIPKRINMGMPMPVPGHPRNKLVNHITAQFFKLPLGLSSTAERLEAIEKEIKTAKQSLMPYVCTLYLQTWLGACFQSFIRFMRKTSAGTGIMSLFPGPEKMITLTGEPIISLGFLMNRIHLQGIYVSGLSFAGNYLIIFGGDESIIKSHEEAQRVVAKIIEELENLRNHQNYRSNTV